MSADFTIDVEPDRDLVRIRMGGFFTSGDIDAFLAARAQAHATLSCGPNRHLTLNDLREMKIQAQESVEMFRAMLADPAYRSRRLAFVIGRTLARTQLQRALDRRTARCFDDPWAAEAWLFAGADRAAA
ncbi:MAG: hypothetical protein IIZ38_07540 [Sphingomonas sp.]|uniref:hypothetical protein n=1 Tax=unclassified Sphingomonas TaxID=196159 RepID=UPI002454BF2F|nr:MULTISPECIES: hypothetical protein [unclassified Sphingomonas]MBQ1498150.1 hypothetical protein [Sphingomonas sp.]MDH4742725.1 hypothetical protein [Sphingomonas sp. CBMAI 2297]